MGTHHTSGKVRLAWATVVGAGLIAGCFRRPSALPSSVTVELPDGTLALVVAGSGAPSLANSQWQFFQTNSSAQSVSFVTATFGPNGELLRFDDNRLAAGLFGDTIIFDGQRRPTLQEGLEYAANSFGAETGDGTGFTFDARFTAFVGALTVGNANATATGTLDVLDPNVMTGSFHFESEVTVPISIPDAEQDQDFAFVAYRLVP